MSHRLAPGFTLDALETYSDAVVCLAVRVFASAGIAHTVPKCKPLYAPLSPSSSHPRFVHRSWPTSVLRSLRGLCTRQVDVELYLTRSVSRFERAYFSPWLWIRCAL